MTEHHVLNEGKTEMRKLLKMKYGNKFSKSELDKKLDKADAVGKKTAEGGEIFNKYEELMKYLFV